MKTNEQISHLNCQILSNGNDNIYKRLVSFLISSITMLAFALCASLVSSVILANCQDIQVLNSLIDRLLIEANVASLSDGLDRIPIPDKTHLFYDHLLLIPIKVLFEGSQGWFQNLSTIMRTGNVSLTSDANIPVLNLRLSLREMQFGYNTYRGKWLGITTSGKLSVDVAQNSFDCKIKLINDSNVCSPIVYEVRLTNESGVAVRITGLGELNFIFSKITTWLTNQFGTRVRRFLEMRLNNALSMTLSKYDICEMVTDAYKV